jgi:hypothetical protein
MTELDLVTLRELAAEPGFSSASTDEADIEAHWQHNNNGRSDTVYSDDAIERIHNAWRGYPRAVNNLALHALTAAFAADHAIVDEKAARIAIAEMTADLTRSASTREYEDIHGTDRALWPVQHPGVVLDAVPSTAHEACLGCQWLDDSRHRLRLTALEQAAREKPG